MRKDHDLLNELDTLDIPEQPLSAGELDRLTRAVMDRVDTANAPAAAASGQKPKVRHIRRRAATFGIAAAVVCALCGTAAAVGPSLVQMLGGDIGFFSGAPDQSEVSENLDAPRGSHDGTEAELTAYNAEVGQTVTDGGVSVTLDNISMDVSSMDVFFTITGDNIVDDALDDESFYSSSDQVWFSAPFFRDCTINGQPIAITSGSLREYYRVDGSTLKMWVHYLLTDIPEGDTVVLNLSETSVLNHEGNWSFSVSLDGNALRAGATQVKAGEYPVGDDVLLLDNLAFGPLGGSITTRYEYAYTDDTQQQVAWSKGMDASQFLITDNTGKELYLSAQAAQNYIYDGTVEQSSVSNYQLTRPADGATSITLTPVSYDVTAETEQRTVTADEMRAGAKIAFSDLGGFTVQDFTVKDSSISFSLVPYGWVHGMSSGMLVDLVMPNDEDVSTVSEEVQGLNEEDTATILRTGMVNAFADPATGIVTIRYDYYAATQEELERIDSFRYYYTPGCALDTANAVTLPLEALS